MAEVNPSLETTVSLEPDFSGAQQMWEEELKVRLPIGRAPYILARLALSHRAGDHLRPFQEKINAFQALAQADEEQTLQPPLPPQLRDEMQVWQNTYNDKIANPEHRLPYRPLELLLAWAVDHGSAPHRQVEKPTLKSGNVKMRGFM
jgi:hypothetical protein